MKARMPRISGAPLTMARIAAETRAASALGRQVLKRSLGIDELANLPERLRADIPLHASPILARKSARPLEGNLPLAPSGGWPPRASDSTAASADRRATPR